MKPHVLILLLIVVLFGRFGSTIAEEPTTQSVGSDEKTWKVARAVELKGMSVSLSEPVLVARSKGFLWFPTLVQTAGGDLMAIFSDQNDTHHRHWTSVVSWSGNGGVTWTDPQPALYGENPLRLENGNQLLLPYALFPRDGGMGAEHQLIPKGKRELRVIESGVIVTGWPRPDQPTNPKIGRSGFMFNGRAISLTDGGYLTTLYGHFKGTKRYSLVVAESQDAVHWKVRSIIANEQCKLKGRDGPCEAALGRLKDGRVMCVFRMQSDEPYGQAFSNDEGKTWTEAIAMSGPFSVQPSLMVMGDGVIALSGGRPGLFVWFNLDGTGKDWQQVDLQAHHNASLVDEPIKASSHTSSYTEIVAVDDRHLLCIYDRIPHGWDAIPKTSSETNSVWVVRLTLERK